jgi:hypothetical protein
MMVEIPKILKRVTVLLFQITDGFLNAAASIWKRASAKIFKISKCFHNSKQKFNFYFLHNKAPKKFKN